MSFDQCSLGTLLAPKGYVRGPFGSALRRPELKTTGVPVYEQQQVIEGHRRFRFFISQEKLEELQRFQVRTNDLVVSCSGTVGRVSVIREEDPKGIISQALLVLRPDVARLLPSFFYYFLTSPEGQVRLLGASHGAVQQNIAPRNVVEQIPIPLPTIDEQRRIAGILSLLDNRIDLLRQTNATLEAIAQALFKSWFIDFDPVRAKAEGREPEGMDAATAALFPSEFEESALGLIPKGWRAGDLALLCAEGGGFIQTGPFGSQLHAADYEALGVPVVMPQDLEARRISIDRVARVSDAHAQRLERHKLARGDVVFSRRGDVGRHAAVSDVEVGWLCGTGCLLVRPGQKWPSSSFVSQALSTSEATEWLKRHAVGATMPNLNTGILGGLPTLLPGYPILRAFERVVRPLDSRIDINRTHAAHLSDLRDTLLPRLISGILRLPEAKTLAEATT